MGQVIDFRHVVTETGETKEQVLIEQRWHWFKLLEIKHRRTLHRFKCVKCGYGMWFSYEKADYMGRFWDFEWAKDSSSAVIRTTETITDGKCHVGEIRDSP